MTRILAHAVCFALMLSGLVAAEKPARPNIIFILADDLGIPGVGCYGGVYKTPQIDALAAGGIRFDYCFSAPLCGPSRAMCMTGRYGFRTGVLDNSTGDKASPQNEVGIARTLKKAGYATAIAGKWRQMSYFTTREDGQAWGFDEFMIWGAASDGERGERYWSPAYNHNGKPLAGTENKYGPDLLQDFVVDFIKRHREQPFFVYYPTPLVHGPIERTPDTKADTRDRNALYSDNIAYLDKLVGKLVQQLDDFKLREKTLVLFVGDNGSVGEATIRGRVISGHKGSVLEGGSRVPLIVNWKGVTPSGKVLNDLVDFTDFYPTLCELAGASLPQGVTLDGRSFAPQLRGEAGKPREWVYVQLGERWYARDQRWKLNQNGQLFDLKDAPFIEASVAADTSDAAAKQARQKLERVLAELNPAAGKTATDRAAKKAARKQKKRANATSTEQ